MRMEGYGISLELPSGWDARLYSRPLVEPSVLPAGLASPLIRTPTARGGAATLHFANFTLPAKAGDFGTAATAVMPAGGVFAALVEYQTGQGLEPGRGLFEAQGIPVPIAPDDLDPHALLRALPGQAGVQRFFSVGDRPFCLYVVVGPASGVRTALSQLNNALLSLAVLDQ
jgi:hypothetical protein